MVADSVVDIATNRALVHQVAWEADRGLHRKQLHAKAAVVKLAASEAAGRVVDRSVQILGGRGYMRENPASGSTATSASTGSGRARRRSSA